jgi:peptidoglycan/xylan/chitin deacetylase (PgdA/CDA1 family)
MILVKIMDIDRENTVFKISEWSGMLNAYSALRRWLTKSQIAILMYHRVCPGVGDPFLQSLTPEDFERQISYVSRNFEILGLDALVERLCSSDRRPRKAVAITFDDGYKDNYIFAYPILSKRGIPATVFLTTGYIGTGRLFWWDIVGYVAQQTSVRQFTLDGVGTYSFRTRFERTSARFQIIEKLLALPEHEKSVLLQKLLDVSEIHIPPDLGKDIILSWSEIKEMAEGSITFGAHTVNHPVLTRIPMEMAEKEIVQSKADIERNLGKKVTAFSYPNGFFSEEVIDITKKTGFACAVAVSPCRLLSPKDSVFRLNRMICNANFYRFKAMLSGFLGDLEMSVKSSSMS